jgi:ribosomal protein S18 acetylase RimI-like enzyme
VTDISLARRIDEACLNAWPALRQVWLDGWLLRYAEGYTRRTNSVHPLCAGTRDPLRKVAVCEALYRAQHLPTIFRIPSILDPALDDLLATQGYAAEDRTSVRFLRLDRETSESTAEVELAPRPLDDWLAGFARFTGLDAAQRRMHGKILSGLCLPAAFAAVRAEGRIASLAYAALHDGLVCVNSVATDPEHRRAGLARKVTAALLDWGRRHDAEAACLAVVAANAPAVALYDGLGFREVYTYCYRREPAR